MMYLNWIDISTKKLIGLKINGRDIYEAYFDEDKTLIDINTLPGTILLNINPQIVRLKYWVVYLSLDNDIKISPVCDDEMVFEMLKHKDVFSEPVDIRLIFRMFEL